MGPGFRREPAFWKAHLTFWNGSSNILATACPTRIGDAVGNPGTAQHIGGRRGPWRPAPLDNFHPGFMASLTDEITRRRTFAIISHPDAGKTTLTEKLLLFGGAIQLAGEVKARGERRRARRSEERRV